MPPQLSDEGSEASEVDLPVQIKKDIKKEKVPEPEKEDLNVETDKEEEDDGDDEVGEDEYVVEKITNHLVDEETGELLFEVKWEGYEKKADRTWEPEENLVTADKILQEYLALHGGKEGLLQAWEDKKKGGSKKRARASTGTTTENGAKRGRKSNGAAHPADSTPPKGAEFKPPAGNWEEEVVQIDACEGAEGTVVVYLTWKGGQKTQHPLAQIYKRCPQKMLKFYESHLVFKKTDDAEPTDSAE